MEVYIYIRLSSFSWSVLWMSVFVMGLPFSVSEKKILFQYHTNILIKFKIKLYVSYHTLRIKPSSSGRTTDDVVMLSSMH